MRSLFRGMRLIKSGFRPWGGGRGVRWVGIEDEGGGGQDYGSETSC